LERATVRAPVQPHITVDADGFALVLVELLGALDRFEERKEACCEGG
jgi:hypothetical protein